MRQIETKNFKRISKAAARKIYENHGEIYMCACNVHPENSYGLLLGPVNTWYPFDNMVSQATFYNCNAELGQYLAFYVRKGVDA